VTHPNRVVVDTNVLVVANGKCDQASPECVIRATEFLVNAQRHAVTVLDVGHDIFSEYQNRCSFKGQPGVGNRFFVYLHQAQADPRRVAKVPTHPDGNDSYVEVPPSLADFDRSDHKFIATFIADERRSVIVNSWDSDWREARHDLAAERIRVAELCPDECPAHQRPARKRRNRRSPT
jgi:hypothetical protein